MRVATPPRAVRRGAPPEVMQICKWATPLFAVLAGTLRLHLVISTESTSLTALDACLSCWHSGACNGWISADVGYIHVLYCVYDKTHNQHTGQPDGNGLLLRRMAYRFLTSSLMVNAPPCRPISVQSHTGRTTREVMRTEQTGPS